MFVPGTSPLSPLQVPSIEIKELLKQDLGAFGPLFHVFLSHFESPLSWRLEINGFFNLQLPRPFRLWIPSTDEIGNEYPAGGTILILENEVSGEFKEGKILQFTNGFHLFCDTHSIFKKRIVSVIKMEKLESGMIEMEAGFSVPIFGLRSGKRQKNCEKYLKEWQEGHVVPQEFDNASYLSSKIK